MALAMALNAVRSSVSGGSASTAAAKEIGGVILSESPCLGSVGFGFPDDQRVVIDLPQTGIGFARGMGKTRAVLGSDHNRVAISHGDNGLRGG